MQLSCSKNKQQVLRRFFNDLQKRIKSRQGLHMNFVNDIHTHFYLRRRIYSIITQIANIVNTVIGCSIDFQNIHTGSGIN